MISIVLSASAIADFILMDIIFITIYILVLNMLRKYLSMLIDDEDDISSKIIDIEEEINNNTQNYLDTINDEQMKYNDKYEVERANIYNRSEEIVEYIHKEKQTILNTYMNNKEIYISRIQQFEYIITQNDKT